MRATAGRRGSVIDGDLADWRLHVHSDALVLGMNRVHLAEGAHAVGNHLDQDFAFHETVQSGFAVLVGFQFNINTVFDLFSPQVTDLTQDDTGIGYRLSLWGKDLHVNPQ